MNSSTYLLDMTDIVSSPFSLCISIFMPLSEHLCANFSVGINWGVKIQTLQEREK